MFRPMLLIFSLPVKQSDESSEAPSCPILFDFFPLKVQVCTNNCFNVAAPGQSLTADYLSLVKRCVRESSCSVYKKEP